MRITGSWVAVPTPFHDDGTVSVEGFNQLIDFHKTHGTDGLLVLGSAGEASMLSTAEKKGIIRAVTGYARNKIPVLVGTTGSNTAESVAMTEYAAECGADGVLMVVPGYITPPQADIYHFFEEVASAVDIPIAVYNNPTRVGVAIEAKTAVKLAAIPGVVALKQAIPYVDQLIEIRRAVDNIDILTCDSPRFSIILPNLALGGSGTANITGNLAPEEFAALSRPWETFEDVKRSQELVMKYYGLMQVCYSVTNPVVIKAGLNLLGLHVGKPRPPLEALKKEKEVQLKKIMEDLGLLEKYRV
jgi:4-hydroxy-tetrahydrodipicolinate synthase